MHLLVETWIIVGVSGTASPSPWYIEKRKSKKAPATLVVYRTTLFFDECVSAQEKMFPSTPVVQENVAMLFCCKTPGTF